MVNFKIKVIEIYFHIIFQNDAQMTCFFINLNVAYNGNEEINTLFSKISWDFDAESYQNG